MGTGGSDEALLAALEQLRYALELLDAANAPPQVGAHVDLAIQQLFSAVAQKSAGGAFGQIEQSVDFQ